MRFKECGYPVGLWVLLLMMPALSRNDHDFAGKNTSKVTMRIEPTWTAAPDIPLAVRAGNTAGYTRNDTGWVYIVSGRDYNERITKTVQRFNATTARWDTVAPHPSGLLGAATAVVEDSLYIIGGVVNPPGTGQRIVHKYDIKENTWSQAAPLPFALVDAKAASYQDSLIYVAGGFTSAINNGLVYLYNAKSRSWRAASFIPSNGRLNFGGFAITGDTLVYMCGTPGFGSPITYNTVYIGVINQVDRAIIDWSTGQAFPGQTRTFFDAHPWGNGGIIMTGGSANNSLNSASDECYVFHPASNRWTALLQNPPPG